MQQQIPRPRLLIEIEGCLCVSPVTVLLGARQVGKTTLSLTKSMHIALQDLGLERLWVIYPGLERYPLAERVTALPLRQLDRACTEVLA